MWNWLFFFEFFLFLAVSGTLYVTWRFYSKHPFDAVAIYVYLFVCIYLCRWFVIMVGLDAPYPEEWTPYGLPEERVRHGMMTLIWCCAFSGAIVLKPLDRWAGKVLILPSERPQVEAFLVVCVGMFILSVLVVAYPVHLYGFNIAAMTYGVRIERIFSGFFFVVNIPALCGYLCSAFVFTGVVQRRNGGWKVSSWVLGLVFCMGALAAGFTLLFGDRDQVVFWAMFNVLGYSLYVRKLSARHFIVWIVLGVGFLSVTQILRLGLWGNELVFDNVVRQISAALNLDFYDKSLMILRYFPVEGMRGGEDFKLGFLGMVPRSLWVDKPEVVDMGAWFRSEFVDNSRSGWPLTVVTEWFLNFGWWGLWVGGLLSGFVYSMINERYRGFIQNPLSFVLLFILAVRIFSLGYNMVTPMNVILWWAPLAICVMFIHIFTKVNREGKER